MNHPAITAIASAAALCLLSFSGAAWAGYTEGRDAYERGDYATAFREFKALAEQGHTGAQHNLADMYATGKGVPRDETRAVRWLRKAAEHGHPDSQVSLGLRYAYGQGVPQDDVQAYAWLKIAVDQGDGRARTHLELTSSGMSPARLARAQALSRTYFEKYVAPFSPGK